MHGLEGLGNIVDTENVSSELQSPVMKDLCCREGFFGSDVEMPVYHALRETPTRILLSPHIDLRHARPPRSS